MNYYERHLGDYAKDTGHLSMLEHGAYTLLLDHCYASEGGIRKDQLYRIARARTKDERAAVDTVVSEFFQLEDDVYTQKRCLEEIERARVRIESARVNGRHGGRPRKKPDGLSPETQPDPIGLLLGSFSETQSKALQAPDSRIQSPSNQSPSIQPPPASGEEGIGQPAERVVKLGEEVGDIGITPSRSPRKGNRETKNADFETINQRVLQLFVAHSVGGKDEPSIKDLVKMAHISDRQAREAIQQLHDRGHLPIKRQAVTPHPHVSQA